MEKSGANMQVALDESTERGVVETLLRSVMGNALAYALNRGCLLVQAALFGSHESAPVRREVTARRCANEAALHGLLERDLAEGDLPPDASRAALAGYRVSGMGNGEWGMGNGVWGMGYGGSGFGLKNLFGCWYSFWLWPIGGRLPQSRMPKSSSASTSTL